MTLPIIDFLFLIVVLAFGVIGVLKGFLNGVFGIAAPILGLWLAAVFCGKLSVPLESQLGIHWLSVILAYLIIFVAVFLIVKIIEKILRGIFTGSIMRSLDRFLGLVLGMAEGVAVVTVIIIVLKAQPWFTVDGLLEGSVFYKVLAPLVASAVPSVTNAVDSAAAAGAGALKSVGK